MWCPQCESDVAGEMSADGQSLQCSRCSTVLQKVFSPGAHPETLAARQLLERWSRQGLSQAVSDTTDTETDEPVPDQAQGETTIPIIETPSVVETSGNDSAADEVYFLQEIDDLPAATQPVVPGPVTEEADDVESRERRSWRIDTPHPRNAGPKRAGRRPPRESVMKQPQQNDSMQRRSDHSHDELPDPHFEVGKIAERPQPGRSESTWGQVLAYSGVGVLTLGTVLVVWGYFGGIETYASTGWLLSTAGQMLLLLGVVTLVSGGMQQTTHEVGQRIEYLNGRMYRIERSTQKILRGPHFGAASGRKRRTGAGHDESGNAGMDR
jgi:hypothetical protein